VVETAEAAPPPVDATWELLRSEAVRDEFVELLVPSARAVPDDALRAVAAGVSGRSPYETLLALVGQVHEHVAYRPGSTGVSTNAVEAWQLGAGVCQDIAHVSLALLREAGIPARYVSGYLHPGGEDAGIGETVRGESHAWVEAWLGDWWAFDPTNGIPAGHRHVVVARGRDYGDVPPLKGVYAGGGSHSLGVVVEVTRLA
jgi:transglutaminase-like putative cysteine protease